jgi:sugar (pentulose or hexulose) kinase
VRREKSAAGEPKKACCMVSEMLEEAGIDRARARQIRRQVLEGVILMCQWQLQRMEEARGARPPGRRGRKIDVE